MSKNKAREKLVGRQKKFSCIISQGPLAFFLVVAARYVMPNLICIILDD
jgi:hypothetical protein